MAHAAKARLLRDELEAATGVRPKYPRSREALLDLRETLDRYNTAKANLKANDARRQGAKNLADELARLYKIEADDFDLDTPTSAGQLEGEAGRLLRRAKAQHQREGATHVFSSWRQETPDPYELGDVAVDDNISIRGGNIVSDYTLTAERATEVLETLEGEYLVKVKFLRERAPGVWVYEDGFAPLNQGRTRGGNVLEVTPETQPGALEGIDQLYYANAYPVSAVVYGLYPIREPDEKNLNPMRRSESRQALWRCPAWPGSYPCKAPENRGVGGQSPWSGRHPSGCCRSRETPQAGGHRQGHHRRQPLQLREVPGGGTDQ